MRMTGFGPMRRRGFVLLVAGLLVLSQFPSSLLAATPSNPPPATTLAPAQPPSDPSADPTRAPGAQPLDEGDDPAEEIQKRDDAYITSRTAGDVPLLRPGGRARPGAGQGRRPRASARRSRRSRRSPSTRPGTRSARTRSSRWLAATMRSTPSRAGVSALAIRPSNGQKILGAAQGGIWTYDETSGTWTARTDDQPTLAIGAIAIAPSDDTIVYAGTGEGNLSGDSYRGDGFSKSTDGGIHWAPVGGDTFDGASIAAIAVDPGNANRLWAAVIRGRAGSRRQTPPTNTTYGIWESDNGGNSWTLRKAATDELHGATDIVEDPLQPNVLYAAFWGDGIYESTDAGVSWHRFMTGIPADATFGTGGGTRFALGISHPEGQDRVLYAGFEWTNGAGQDQPSQVWKSVAGGAWTLLPSGGSGSDNVSGYCGTQCFYDNVIGVDPTDPNTVYVLGLFNYGTGSGGVFRSTDGGQTWKDLGWDLHPDYHAIAINPADTSQVMIGNDGGVWYSGDKGGRLADGDPVAAVDWQDLNGTVDPDTSGVLHRTGLMITQFTSIANVPTLPARVWGGTQDNGTLRKSTLSASWFDVESGDGGQVLVDPTDEHYVYGNYFGISPYRNTDGGNFFTNAFIRGGINPLDRSEFYVPEVMNLGNPNQLFLGTFRLYRTDNAKAPNASDVRWDAISPDLTSGCTGGAANGARGCVLSAMGVSGGGDGVYAGTLEGWVWFSPDGVTSATPTWIRVGQSIFPNRPIADIAVDRSNDRIAYVAFNGFNAGHAQGAGPRLQDDRRRQQLAGHQLQPARCPGQLHPARCELPEHDLRRHRRRSVRDVQRREELAEAGHRLPERRDLAAQPRPDESKPRRRHARPRRLDDARHPVRARPRGQQGRCGRAGRSRQPDRLHHHRPEHRQRRCDGRLDRRSDPRQHDVHLRRRRRRPDRQSRPSAGQLDRVDGAGRQQRGGPLHGHDRLEAPQADHDDRE